MGKNGKRKERMGRSEWRKEGGKDEGGIKEKVKGKWGKEREKRKERG